MPRRRHPLFATRSPIERAILAFVQPKLLQTERDFLEKNTFQLVYRPFDWSLNDLTGRGGRVNFRIQDLRIAEDLSSHPRP